MTVETVGGQATFISKCSWTVCAFKWQHFLMNSEMILKIDHSCKALATLIAFEFSFLEKIFSEFLLKSVLNLETINSICKAYVI